MDKLARSYVWHQLVLARLRVGLEDCENVKKLLEQRESELIRSK